MSTQLFTALLTVFVLGLFFGTNLGVILICVLQAAGQRSRHDTEMVPVVTYAEASE
jgi:hypothetical protein